MRPKTSDRKGRVQGGRLRPVLMTAFTTSLGLLPLLLANDVGANVQRPLVAVVISGLVTSILLTLLVLRTIYQRVAEATNTVPT